MTDHTLEEPACEPQEATVVVSRTVAYPIKHVWKVVMTTQGAEALLGPGADFGQKGHTWTAQDGCSGVMRSLHPMEEIRFTLRREGQATPTTVELTVVPDGDTTVVRVEHSRLPLDADLDGVKARWEAALTRIEACLAE